MSGTRHLKIMMICLILIVSSVQAQNFLRNQICQKIRQAFHSGRFDILDPYLSDQAKIFVSIPEIGIVAGNYSKGQFLTLFKEKFKYIQTEHFVIQQSNRKGSAREPIKAEWVFYHQKKRKTIRTTIYITIVGRSKRITITAVRGSTV
jgi:hypothetical protein